MFQIRTDLALETREKFDEDHIEVKGVRVDEERNFTGNHDYKSIH